MSDSRATDIIDQQQKLRGTRGNWDRIYQEIADYCWPQMADFNVKRAGGEKRTEKIFDSTACMALERGSAAFHSLMVPDHQIWHGLGLQGVDLDLQDLQPVKAWLEQVRDALFTLRRSPVAAFSSQAQESIRTLLGFGTQCMFVDELYGEGKRGSTAIRYKSIHLSEIDFTENAHGLVDVVFRQFEYTARQCAEMFGADVLPEKIKAALEKKDEVSKFEIIHCVEPNKERDPRRIDAKGKRFSSSYVSVEGKAMLGEGGYRRFPYLISRYATNPREGRGRGPAMVLLPDVKMLNEQEKTRLRAGQLSVAPPLLLYEDGLLQGFQMRPHALNFGGVDDQGRQMVQPLQVGANLPWANELMEERRKIIRSGFWLEFFQALLDNPQMTATQAMLLAQQSGQFLASPLGRQQTEWFGPQIRREIDIAAEAGLLPFPPEELAPYLDSVETDAMGNVSWDMAEDVEIEYTSPMSQMLMAEEAVKANRYLEQLMPLANIDPTVLDVLNKKKYALELARWNGVSSKLFLSEREIEDIGAQRAQRQQASDLLAAAPVAADAAKSLAQAAATAGTVPQTIPSMAQ